MSSEHRETIETLDMILRELQTQTDLLKKIYGLKKKQMEAKK